MRIQSLHTGFIMPKLGSELAGGFDIFMPEAGFTSEVPTKVGLGFATEIPAGHVALILPRSGVGSKFGVELNNTCGVIDADYRGEWFATLRTKGGETFKWEAGERVLQFLVVPVVTPQLELVDSVSKTERGVGGLGSSGK